ncbi:MAG: zinc-ribbon domain-containing protein, partial [Comamonas sp.]
MQVFHCDQCGHIAFFDNVQCVHCGATLAYVPEARAIQALAPVAGDTTLWQPVAGGLRYRMCANRLRYQACNFAVREDDPHELCVSCRQTRILPDLSVP